MTKEDIKHRTKQDAIQVIKLCDSFPKTTAGFELAKQIIRSAMSVASNYRAACRAKSTADFIYKLSVVIEEADETFFWLEMVEGANLTTHSESVVILKKEYDELVAIFTASVKTIKAKDSGQGK